MNGDAKSSKGVRMYLSKAAPSKATVTPTAVSKASPTVITAPAPGAPVTTYKVGQTVYITTTGFPEIDGKWWTVSAAAAGTFTLKGSNTTTSTGVLVASPKVDVYESTDFVQLCLATFAFNLETAGTIPAGTYCNPTYTLAGTPTGVGTATLGGWIDVSDPGYQELRKAVDDGISRVFDIVLPQSQGEIITPMIVTGTAWDIPLDGGMGYTATATLQTAPNHVF